jgi:prolipoprotein diacylglyceryltransferase
MSMTFPFFIHIGALTLHPHLVFETLAYFIGFRIYLLTRSKDRLPPVQSTWVIVAAILGAAVGSKLLFWFEDPQLTVQHWNDPFYLMGGKTIVGALLGGLLTVEWMKKRIGVTRSTGDDFVFPLITGMAIGRIGCFLSGLPDHTYGNPTALWTGVDFGDGIPRHPTQLYEIVFLLALAGGLALVKLRARRQRNQPSALPEGALFQLFMTGYLLFRFFVDFIKPTVTPYLGLNNMQVACLAALFYYIWKIRSWLPHSEPKGVR